jgi:hypothetical protein
MCASISALLCAIKSCSSTKKVFSSCYPSTTANKYYVSYSNSHAAQGRLVVGVWHHHSLPAVRLCWLFAQPHTPLVQHWRVSFCVHAAFALLLVAVDHPAPCASGPSRFLFVSMSIGVSHALSLSVSVSCGEVHTCRSNSSCTVCCTCGLETIESKCDVFDGSPMLLLVVVLVLCE